VGRKKVIETVERSIDVQHLLSALSTSRGWATRYLHPSSRGVELAVGCSLDLLDPGGGGRQRASASITSEPAVVIASAARRHGRFGRGDNRIGLEETVRASSESSPTPLAFKKQLLWRRRCCRASVALGDRLSARRLSAAVCSLRRLRHGAAGLAMALLPCVVRLRFSSCALQNVVFIWASTWPSNDESSSS